MVFDGKEYLTPEEEEAVTTHHEGPTVSEIFSSLPNRFRAEKAGDLQEVFRFEISGNGGGTWTVQIANGEMQVREGAHEAPGCSVQTDADTYVAVETGQIKPQDAFMAGRITVDNIPAMMALSGSLSRLS